MIKHTAALLGAAALAVLSGTAAARTNIDVGIAFGVPAPVYVAPRPPVAYYPAPVYAPAPVYVQPAPVYYGPPAYYGPRYYGPPVVIRDRGWHRGWYRGHGHGHGRW